MTAATILLITAAIELGLMLYSGVVSAARETDTQNAGGEE